MKISNVINRVHDKRDRERNWEKLHGAMVYRVGIDDQTGITLGFDAVSISDHFTGKDKRYPSVAKATKGDLAYSIMIGGDRGPPRFNGKIWQTLTLDEVGSHARRWSAPYLGIGCIGDFRKGVGKKMSPKQYASLTDLLVLICNAFSWDPYRDIKGHGEVPKAHGGEKAPGEPAACPGDLLNMNHLRDDVATLIRDNARRHLHDAGLIFTG